MHYTIYKTTHIASTKIYIGKHQTNNPNDNYLGSGKYLQHAITKYGKAAFIKEILFDYNTEQEMNDKEKELVTEEFCMRTDTYNLCVGGQGGFSYINRHNLRSLHTPESRKSLSETCKRQGIKPGLYCHAANAKLYQDGNKPMPPSFKGKRHTNETKELMSQNSRGKATGRKNSQFGTMWITDNTINKKIAKDDIIPNGWIKGRKIK
jgi:hypothetical protein